MENKESNDRNLTNENVVAKSKIKNARKEGLTKGALITSLIGFILLLALGVLVYSLYNREQDNQLALMEDQQNSFTKQLSARDSTINDWLLTFDQIEKDLNMIKQKENLITVKSSDAEFSEERKEQILEDIRYINTLLDNNKKRIAALSSQLRESGGAIKGLQDKIVELEASIKQREDEIAELKLALVNKDIEIGQLNNRMTDLEITIVQQDEKIIDQTNKLNQAYLAYGTYKDLKEKGIVDKEGGFLGLGRKESLVEDFADSLFTPINVTETKTIPVNSKDVKFITEHPANSYELIHEGDDKIASIEIKDPDQFWKISKYAVVEVSK